MKDYEERIIKLEKRLMEKLQGVEVDDLGAQSETMRKPSINLFCV